MIRNAILIFIISSFYIIISAQEKVSFYADDSLKITADLYLKDYNLPFILLFHQADASRGEYSEIATRLLKLDYNCLAVDLRSGGKINFVSNETAQLAKQGKYSTSLIDARKDISAAINYIKKYNSHPPVLMGSSYSASLCMMEADNGEGIKAVVAFSPGEYFRPDIVVKKKIKGITIPLYISATTMEYQYIEEMLKDIPETLVTFYQPSKGSGEHGAKMLWQSNESSDECWLDLLLFFKKIRY